MKNNENPMTKAEFKQYIEAAQKGSVEARNVIVARNIGLVWKVVGDKYYWDKANKDDYFQEGCTGLMRAIETFDLKRNLAFSTYATLWIHQKIGRYIQDTKSMIRVPAYAQSFRVSYHIQVKQNPDKDKDEIIRELCQKKQVSLENAAVLLNINMSCGSLHVPSESGDEREIETSDEGMIGNLRQLDVDYLLTQLTFQEYRYMTRRLAGETFESIGKSEGLSREWIRQVCDKAIETMTTIDNLRGSE